MAVDKVPCFVPSLFKNYTDQPWDMNEDVKLFDPGKRVATNGQALANKQE